MYFITKHYKPVTLGFVGALIYCIIVNYSPSVSIMKMDRKMDVPFVLRHPYLPVNSKQRTAIRKPAAIENFIEENRVDRSNPNLSKAEVANGPKRVSSIKRGWSYKGPGRWRCKVQTVGCFNAAAGNISKSFALLVDSSSDMTDSQCVLQCSKRMRGRFVFAGLRNGNECRCAEKPHYLINPEELSNRCTLPCTGDKSRKCGGRRGLTILYMIKSKCMKDEPPINVTDGRSTVGCYRKPRYLRAIMEEYKIATDWKAARCIIQCENVGLVLAIPVQPNICYCGLTGPRFNLSSPVDAARCSKSNANFVTVYRTNSEDKRCGQKRFLKAGELHWKVGLITFPGSGNTWVRHLIESATGIYTGSVYSDPNLINGGYLGELLPPESNKVAVVKSHHQKEIPKMKYLDALINVYRNPYDAILSEYNRRERGHTGSIDKKKFDAAGLTNLAGGPFIRKWHMTTKLVLNGRLPNFVFSYDELLKNPILLAEKMARFIMGNTLDENDLQARLSCMYLASKGDFKRKKKYYNFDPYSRSTKVAINREIVELDKDFKKFRKPTILQYVRPIDNR